MEDRVEVGEWKREGNTGGGKVEERGREKRGKTTKKAQLFEGVGYGFFFFVLLWVNVRQRIALHGFL